MKPIYEIERHVDQVKLRLQNSGISETVKDKISEFVSFAKEANDLTKHREYFLYTRLLILASTMDGIGKKGNSCILSPTKKEVVSLISRLREMKTLRHTNYSPASISDFKKTLKRFVKYCNEGELEKFWNDIHSEKIGSRYKEPGEMIDYDELQQLVKACNNSRDKAIITLLWDSGLRASELLSLRMKDFQRSPDSMYATIDVSAETSKTRKQRIVVLTGDSVVKVSEWIEERKDTDPDPRETDFLFVGIGKENMGEALNYADLRMLLQKVLKRSGLKKKVSPHLFRHTAATRFATELPTQVFVKQMGWTSNKMADNYTHLDNKGQIVAILKSHGVPITDEELKKPKSKVTRRCLRCHAVNTGGSRFCNNCGTPLLEKDFHELERERQKVIKTLRDSTLINEKDKEYLKDVSPELQSEILVVILKALKKQGKFDELRKLIPDDEE